MIKILKLFCIAGLILQCYSCAKKAESESKSADTVVQTMPVETPIAEVTQNTGYIETGALSEGLKAVKNEGGWGFVDEAGTLVIPCKYAGAGAFKDGRAVIRINTQDWRNNYRIIDKTGKDLGNFFDELPKDSCDAADIVINGQSGESYSTDLVSRCRGGIISTSNQGWEWGGEDAFYPDITIEQGINLYCKSHPDAAGIFKNFKNESIEFEEGEYKNSIAVEKNPDGSLSKVKASRSSDMSGYNVDFSKSGNGVLIACNYGS